MQKIKTKSITRSDWPRVLRKSFVCDTLEFPSFHGVAALIRMDEVVSPLVAHSCGKEIVLADNGYYWVQIAPDIAHWWLTYMLDPDGNIYQYYFDITLENRIDKSKSAFDDLFLDVVALPNGMCEMLDLEELKEALRDNVITRDQYQLALNEADMLMHKLPERMDELNTFGNRLFMHLCSKLDAAK